MTKEEREDQEVEIMNRVYKEIWGKWDIRTKMRRMEIYNSKKKKIMNKIIPEEGIDFSKENLWDYQMDISGYVLLQSTESEEFTEQDIQFRMGHMHFANCGNPGNAKNMTGFQLELWNRFYNKWRKKYNREDIFDWGIREELKKRFPLSYP